MAISLLEYPLQNGYIHHWLVAGPKITPLPSPAEKKEQKIQIAKNLFNPQVGIEGAPVDRDECVSGETKLKWKYVRCQSDHLVDVSLTQKTWGYLENWAYTCLNSNEDQTVSMVLTSSCPVDIWLNGAHIAHQDAFAGDGLQKYQFQGQLEKKDNELCVRLIQVSGRECLQVMALQIVDLPSEASTQKILVHVPTHAKRPARHVRLENALEMAYLDQVTSYKGRIINLRWSELIGNEEIRYAYQVQDIRNRIYVDGSWFSNTEEATDVGHPQRLFERQFWVVLKATSREYFSDDLQYERRLPIYVMDNEYHRTPYSDFKSRLKEGLKEAGKYENNLFSEIAKMQMGNWSDINTNVILQSIEHINQREDGSINDMVGLLGIMHRYLKHPSFPENLNQPLEACVLNYRYWQDEPGTDSMDFSSESSQILFPTAQILAGQLYTKATFSNSGLTGKKMRQKGEKLAIDCLQVHGRTGFREWDSHSTFDQYLVALSHLTSLADDDAVRELSAILMDKIFFSMAINSYKGSFGASHGLNESSMIKSSQMEATAGVTLMMWGLGVFNKHIQSTVSLACSTYEFPVLIGEIANHFPEDMWNREHQTGLPTSVDGEGVYKVTYKTPDYMLSSAQDYRPGEKGDHEHIWQATFGDEAMVFTNHPGNMSEDNAHLAGFWHGNSILPRVAQLKDLLIAIHNMPENDWMGFTHAYFPIHAFDEYEIKDGWAFARKGEGYLALYASAGIELTKQGNPAYRELRSVGKQNIWICQMGRTAIDGSFSDFIQKTIAIQPVCSDLSVKFKSLRNDDLSFGWQQPFFINGKEEKLSGYPHYENTYCTASFPADKIEIAFNGTAMELNFE